MFRILVQLGDDIPYGTCHLGQDENVQVPTAADVSEQLDYGTSARIPEKNAHRSLLASAKPRSVYVLCHGLQCNAALLLERCVERHRRRLEVGVLDVLARLAGPVLAIVHVSNASTHARTTLACAERRIATVTAVSAAIAYSGRHEHHSPATGATASAPRPRGSRRPDRRAGPAGPPTPAATRVRTTASETRHPRHRHARRRPPRRDQLQSG